MKKVCLASLAIAAMLGAGCNKTSNAAKNETAGTAGRVEVSSGDRDFVQDVTRANAAEIDLSRLAVDKSSSPDVKRFAQMMVDDHTAAGAKLSGVASQNSIDAMGGPDDAHLTLHDKLAAKQGLDFEKDYIDAIVDNHDKFIDTLASRVDKSTADQWKDAVSKEPDVETAKADIKAGTILPEKTDNDVTRHVNAWAADTYPAAYTHLLEAKTLKDTLKKRVTD